MDIILRNNSDTPLYLQMYEQISAQIVGGKLKGGVCLPPIRTVASELCISVITVKKAWEELEKRGFIRTVAGSGCYVSEMHPAEAGDKRCELAVERLRKDVGYCTAAGLTDKEILDAVRLLLDDSCQSEGETDFGTN